MMIFVPSVDIFLVNNIRDWFWIIQNHKCMEQLRTSDGPDIDVNE